MQVATAAFLLSLLALGQSGGQLQPWETPRYKNGQKYAAEGFEVIPCLAGQVRVRGRRVSDRPFSVLAANEDKKCCGAIVRAGRTDKHGHFLVEPLAEGRYFVKFEAKDSEHSTSFAIPETYKSCGSEYVTINFSDPKRRTIESFIYINDSDDDCREDEPACYRR